MDLARLSACTYPFRKHPWREALGYIASAGFRKVDLLGRAPHFVVEGAPSHAAEINVVTRDLGLLVANLGTYVGRGFASLDQDTQEAELDALCRAVDAASFLGARSVRVMPGDDTLACLDRIIPWFRQGAEYARSRCVHLGFETHGGAISGWPPHCADLVDRVGSAHFGVLFDPCNLMRAGVDYRMALWTLRGRIAHVHLKDGLVDREGFRLTMLGQGQLDLRWIIDTLEVLGYTGDVALEYELDHPRPEDGLRAWLAAAAAI